MPQEILDYNSVCMLIGRLILQHQLQVDQMGKQITEAHSKHQAVQEENVRLRQELSQLKYNLGQNHDSDRKRENNQSDNSRVSEM